MEFTGIIYCIQNQVNKKRYIGQTVYAWYDRWRDHLRKACSGEGFALHKAMRKYGIEKFIVKVVEVVSASSIKELSDLLNEREIYWIAVGNTFHNGYNEDLGGKGRRLIDDETARKMFEMWELGYFLDEIRFEFDCAETTVRRILCQFGVKEKIRERARDVNSWQAKPVAQIDFDTRAIFIHDSMTDAAQSIGHCGGVSAISQCCSGIQKSAYDYYWKYFEDVDEKEILAGHYYGYIPERYAPERQYDYENIQRLFDLGYTQLEIANIVGCSSGSVSRILDTFGVSRDDRLRQGMASRVRAVVALDEQGEIIAEYESIAAAASTVSVHPSTIGKALEYGSKSADCYWRYKDIAVKEHEPPIDNRTQYAISRGFPVVQLDDQGNIIAEYYSINKAARSMGKYPSNIQRAIERGGKYAGYYWQYKDN